MAKDINITSQEWTDIVFEGKNKDYGAYEMRKSSSKRHVISLLISIVIVVFVSFLPTLIKTVVESRRAGENISESTVFADLQKQLEDQIEEKNIIREDTAPPPPPLKNTIQFTAPEIVRGDEIEDDQAMRSQEELAESKVQISILTIDGVDDVDAVDIADLKNQQVIADVKDDEVFYITEQPAQFPGGDEALKKYLNANLKYPDIAQENGIYGRVTVKFIVSKTGEISGIEILRGVHASLDKEAIRLVAAMPKWIPAKQNGKAVNVHYQLPVSFVLQ